MKPVQQKRQISWTIDIPIIIDALLLLDIQISMSCSGDVNVFQWNRKKFFSRRVKFDCGFNVMAMAVYGVCWHGPKIIHRFTGIRKESWGGWPSPRIGRSRIKVGVLSSWSLPESVIRPSANGKINSPFSLGNITSFALSLCVKISDASIVCNSSMSATNTSPFQIHLAYKAYPRNKRGKTFFPNWWILDWSFAVIGWYSTNVPNGIIGSLNDCPNVSHIGSSHQTRDL